MIETDHYLATDAAEVNSRITGRSTDTNNHHSLVSVAVCVSDKHIHRNNSKIHRRQQHLALIVFVCEMQTPYVYCGSCSILFFFLLDSFLVGGVAQR